MAITTFRGRKAVSIENEDLRVTVMREGGHIAEILEKKTGASPLWVPPWPTIEPSAYSSTQNPEYGSDSESRLLSGIMGHSLCLDFYGGPSAEEAVAGFGVHGEAPVVPYDIIETGDELRMRADLPLADLRFERRIRLYGSRIWFSEHVENLAAVDRPIGWTEHVTLGPPFLERGVTEFRVSGTRSKTFESDFGRGDYLRPNTEFTWPLAPSIAGGTCDLRVYNSAPISAAFTTHLADARGEHAFFIAFSRSLKLVMGYIWKRTDFPWIGIWEENHSRNSPPWNGQTMTRGMEFGVSPFPESRRQMVDRGQLFGVPTYRWLPAKSRMAVEYWAMANKAESIPERLEWPG